MDMNSPIGKEILALVRKADYAHAGSRWQEENGLILSTHFIEEYWMLLKKVF